ncbi:MAG: DUF3826 domain-containing protein [Tepidisphaeraceae bacterium]
MSMRRSAWSLVVLKLLVMSSAVAAPAAAPADAEAAYTKVVNKRADDVIAVLKIDDTARAGRVREILIGQYRALRDVNDARDAKLKSIPKDDKEQADNVKADADAALKPLHRNFLTKLGTELTPEQVEIVKDKMTMGKVKNDYNAFLDMLPDLTDVQKAHILAQLREAREIAMDAGSSEAKHAVFGKYRGRINNYLSKEGYDLKKASRDWADRRKSRDAQAKQAASTQPAN